MQVALNRLKQKGFVTYFSSDTPKNVWAFWSDLNLTAINEVKQKIFIHNFSRINSLALKEALTNLFLQIEETEALSDIYIVIAENYISKQIEIFNSTRLKDKKPWLLVKPTGNIIWIGPIFEPEKTGCWNCLSQRLKENRRVEVDLFGLSNDKLNINSLSSLQGINQIAFNLTALEIAKWEKAKNNHYLYHHLITFNLGNLELKFHPFQTLHNCDACQVFTNKNELPKIPVLKSSNKRFFYDDGERSCSLDETCDLLLPYVSPVTGIISSLKHAIVNDQHICYTVRNLPLPFIQQHSYRYLRIPDAATGKGKTKLQATVGCLAEAIERYNCSFFNQFEIRCSNNELQNDFIPPSMLLNFSEKQYKKRDEINRLNQCFNIVPKPYDGSEIGWTPVFSLNEKKFSYVPSAYCYLSYPYEKDIQICPGDSNGCASGNSLEEAIFYGILELVERDAVAIWWYNRIKRPCIDLKSFSHSPFEQLQVNLQKKGRYLYVLDLTSDLNIPCYAAASWKFDGSEIIFGTAAHLNPRVAVSRAISELNQIMMRSDTPKDIDLNSIPRSERNLVKWIITEKIEDHPYFLPSQTINSFLSNNETNDFLSDIDILINILIKNNLNVFIHDLSNPDIKFYTIKVIIPKLRHFWNRLGPGRLYDVPVKLEWIPKVLDESELNPIPYFL